MSKNRYNDAQRILIACGIVGPIFYTIVLFILGALWPGYSHLTQYMSELGSVGAPHAIVMNTLGFPLLGLILVAFSIALYRGIKKGRASWIGPALVALSGIGLILSGFFRCDPGCVDVSITGRIHSYAAILAALPMTLAPLTVSPMLDRKYQAYSFITGIDAGVISMLYQFQIFEFWKGALQRLAMAVPLLWVEVMSFMLLSYKPK